MNVGGVTPLIVVAHKRRNLIEAFRRARAVSPEGAKTFPEVGVEDSSSLRRLVSSGVVVPLGDGLRFYLDESAETEAKRRILRSGLIALAVVLVFFFATIWIAVR